MTRFQASAIALATVLLGPGCSTPRYAQCAADGRCGPDQTCSTWPGDASGICLNRCEIEPFECAPDELCNGNDFSCVPAGTTAPGALCARSGSTCVAGYTCTGERPDAALDSYRCHPICAFDANIPADDSQCATGLVCVALNTFSFITNTCVSRCDPADPEDCPPDYVCGYRQCLMANDVLRCGDGSICAHGEICDREAAPPECLTPVEFDARYPRPGGAF